MLRETRWDGGGLDQRPETRTVASPSQTTLTRALNAQIKGDAQELVGAFRFNFVHESWQRGRVVSGFLCLARFGPANVNSGRPGLMQQDFGE